MKLELALPETLCVMGNGELLSQAISNLLDNAIKYGGEQIALIGEVIDDQLAIKIIDNGTGIVEEDRTRVIDRFVRLDKSRNMTGNGLGLSLVKAISEMHKSKFKLLGNDPGLVATLEIPVLVQ